MCWHSGLLIGPGHPVGPAAWPPPGSSTAHCAPRVPRTWLRPQVKVEGERIKKVVALPSACGAGPLALYRALGGQAA